MQYLSRAYNYYSGINPATLSGAIDVIVVRHVDANGDVTLSGSPFHVRFGKLQVIRAGEKRVTVRLPNNLPAPHVAPFSMKVGETGEAFFVLETDEDVPEDLMTSPVVMPTATEQPDELDTSPASVVTGSSAPVGPETYLTQQPFGDTEKQFVPAEELGEVDFLDLNAPTRSPSKSPKVVTPPTSVLDTAASYMPSIPFMGHSHDEEDNNADGLDTSSRTRTELQSEIPPNPLEAKPGESIRMPSRDHRLSAAANPELSPNIDPSDALPRVRPGEGDGPHVQYGKDIVLDGTGYHHKREHSGGSQASTSDVRESVLDTFTRDLEAALPVDHRPPLALRATDPDVQSWDAKSFEAEVSSRPDRAPSPARHERATSEPPPDAPEPASPTLDASRTALAMDYAWDWGRIPEGKTGNDVDPEDLAARRADMRSLDLRPIDTPRARLKGVEENPYLFVLELGQRVHTFELALCPDISIEDAQGPDLAQETAFLEHRVTFQRFIEEPQVVDDPALVIRYSLRYSTWSSNHRLLNALARYRRDLSASGGPIGLLPSLGELGVDTAPSSGYGWSKWWRRSQAPSAANVTPASSVPDPQIRPEASEAVTTTNYAKTLRLSSDQLKQLDLKLGPNTVQFSVTSSYSGMAMCSARIFLWESTDQIVISDIDGTITKSDALGHVYAAIGRDWTHLGIAKLYTDITNNGYRMLYLTSRAIGQADSTRSYLKSIVQGEYRLPEGPVIMSPDRLMASLHREVIMRKPELFKMACLRDIQRLFLAHAQEAFFAGFGNRITDAMSYRSVGIPAAKIYTIDSTGVVKTELLQAAGHKGSYIQLNDLVNETFPPMSTKFKPEYTDFNYWRSVIADFDLPDLTPPSPALSARSDTSGRLSVLGKITGLGRRSSRQPILPTSNPASRPSSPLMGPAISSDDLSDLGSRGSSMPGSYEDKGGHFPTSLRSGDGVDGGPSNTETDLEAGEGEGDDYEYDDDDIFDDDLLATGEMRNVPF